MVKWGYDEVNGVVIGGNEIACQLYYDGRPQKNRFCADNDNEALTKAKEIKQELLKEYGGHPCFLYQDDSKWELRLY